jgi:CubicO group peptidase (beta-lactamase class C family)
MRPAPGGNAGCGGRAVELVRAYGGIAQLYVLRYGQVVLDRQVRWTPQALFWLFSASKPFIAAQVHLLAEREAISLDDPVAAHWPEYASHGKDGITVRHVLTRRAGVPFASGSEPGDALTMTRWHRAILPSRMVAEMKALAHEMPADSGAPAGAAGLAQINLLWTVARLGTISAHRS